VASCCEQSVEHSNVIGCRNFLDYLKTCQLIKDSFSVEFFSRSGTYVEIFLKYFSLY
jgi:hypothetical protein